MPLAPRRHDAPFVPPLQLAGGDPGQDDHVVGCEQALHLVVHSNRVLFQTNKYRNVSPILGGERGNQPRFRRSLC